MQYQSRTSVPLFRHIVSIIVNHGSIVSSTDIVSIVGTVSIVSIVGIVSM